MRVPVILIALLLTSAMASAQQDTATVSSTETKATPEAIQALTAQVAQLQQSLQDQKAELAKVNEQLTNARDDLAKQETCVGMLQDHIDGLKAALKSAKTPAPPPFGPCP